MLLSHLRHVLITSSSVDATTYITITHVTYVDPTSNKVGALETEIGRAHV